MFHLMINNITENRKFHRNKTVCIISVIKVWSKKTQLTFKGFLDIEVSFFKILLIICKLNNPITEAQPLLFTTYYQWLIKLTYQLKRFEWIKEILLSNESLSHRFHFQFFSFLVLLVVKYNHFFLRSWKSRLTEDRSFQQGWWTNQMPFCSAGGSFLWKNIMNQPWNFPNKLIATTVVVRPWNLCAIKFWIQVTL